MRVRSIVLGVFAGSILFATQMGMAIRFEPTKGYVHQVRYVCTIEHQNEGSVHIGSSKLLKYAKINARTHCQYTTHSDGCTHNDMSCEKRDVWVKRRW